MIFTRIGPVYRIPDPVGACIAKAIVLRLVSGFSEEWEHMLLGGRMS